MEPLKWSKPKTVFVNSMSDLFHEEVPDIYIEQVTRVMQLANWHTYQVLTKRASRLRELLSSKLRFAAELAHIWWGTSVEDRRYGVPRIEELRHAPAKVRFLSIEPLLEDLGTIDLTDIHWVIVGGESGAGARPMKEEWVVSLQRQCKKAKVPFFFKQWGGVRKSATGRELKGRTFDEMPSRTSNSVVEKEVRQKWIADLAEVDELAQTPLSYLASPVVHS
jgi:protein gp37